MLTEWFDKLTMSGTSLPQQLGRLDLDRLRGYRENLDFYHGEQWEGRVRPRQRRLTFNYGKVFIDKVTSYLMSGFDFAVEPVAASQAAKERARRAEEALYRVYEANGLEQLDFDTEIDAAILGDGAYKVFWDAETRQVRVTAPDVQGLYAWWVGDDLSRVWRVASRYQLSPQAARRSYGLSAQRPVTVIEVWTDESFELWLDGKLRESRPNPYGFIPFVIFPNLREPKSFWGVSDLEAFKAPARELNRALSALSAILELSGNPIAVLENVDKAEDIAVQPGAVWELPEDARAYLLDLLSGGGVGLHIEYLNLLYRALHDLAETPRTSFGDNSRGLSGVALEMELHPLLQKVKRKRLIRTAAYRRRNELVLRLLEQKTGVSYRPYRSQIVWGSVLPQDRSRQVADEERLVRAGLHSHRGAMDALGVEDSEREWARWLEEAAQQTGSPAFAGKAKGPQT